MSMDFIVNVFDESKKKRRIFTSRADKYYSQQREMKADGANDCFHTKINNKIYSVAREEEERGNDRRTD